ncbi:MAG TPA: type II toxin-antitoxin system death-on-curing family toxin [Pyrinomonadaceae bacterium]|jgi:death-on-curing protein
MVPKWIRGGVALAMHSEQIAEHGGTAGVRDPGLLESALARPQNFLAYGEDVDTAALAASYAFGLAKNHPFLDGNKRTALVVSVTFLNLNGYDFDATPSETYTQFLGLAEGLISQEQLSTWFRERLYLISDT